MRARAALLTMLVASAALAVASVPAPASAAGAYPNPHSRACPKLIVRQYHRVFVRASRGLSCGRAREVTGRWYVTRTCWDFADVAPSRRTCRVRGFACEARSSDPGSIEQQAVWARCRRGRTTATIQTFPESD